MTVRVRFAPSPTGFLHVGGARTALFNWLWARHNGGQFILRIEDTDLERSTKESTEQILESMKWLGLDWDEGPFYQSERFDVYYDHLQKLIDMGLAYRSFETSEELDAQREAAKEAKQDWIYDRASLKLTEEEVNEKLAAGTPFVWRFKTPDEGHTKLLETLMVGSSGAAFENARISDFPLTRSGTEETWGAPLFNFCCAVDDAVMEITNVIRGADHVTNTARQVLILEALGYQSPTYTHLPLITKAGKKMSKRDGDADPRYPVSVSARRDVGYLKEAMVNFIALLGWSFDDSQEIFDAKELVQKFTLNALSKSNANFDEDKFLHMNAHYMKSLPPELIAERVKPLLDEAGMKPTKDMPIQWYTDLVQPETERCKLLSDFPEALRYYFERPTEYDAKAAKKFLSKESVSDVLREVAESFENLDDFSQEIFENTINLLGEKHGLGFGKIAQPVRISITGRGNSPGLAEVIQNMGLDEVIHRIRNCADWIDQQDWQK